MKNKIRNFLRRVAHGPLEPLVYVLWDLLARVQHGCLRVLWALTGVAMPTLEEQKLVREQVTFLYKSFERQNMAKELYHNIQWFYPGARVIVADDSRQPLELEGDGLTVIQLPFNSGLSRGLNAALAQVETPFVMRMDDDELLCPLSVIHRHLKFLEDHPQVDLVGVLPRNIPFGGNWREQKKAYFGQSMAHSPRPLIIPHLTWIDERHVVLGKVPNIFLARTGKYRALGYDDHIRMIDHQEFFFRAAGNLVSVLDVESCVLHRHNQFHAYYQKFREDVDADRLYISRKYAVRRNPERN